MDRGTHVFGFREDGRSVAVELRTLVWGSHYGVKHER